MKFLNILIFSLLAILYTSCGDDKVCDTDNPLEELSWLKDIRDQFDSDGTSPPQTITQYTYNGASVFLVDACASGCADALTYVYNCEGMIICEFGGIDGRNTCPDFQSESKDAQVLYSK